MNTVYERDVTTVFLEHRDDAFLRPFYCCKCGKCVCEVVGDVSVLVPGLPDAIDIRLTGVRSAYNCNGFVRLRNGTNIKCDAKYIF